MIGAQRGPVLLGLVMGMILQQVLHSVFLREACPDIPPCPACPACQPLPTGLLKAARSECPACPRCPDPAPACPECDPQSCPACPEAPACPDAPPCEAPGAPAAGAAPEAAKPRHLLPLIHSCSWNKVLHKKVVSNAVVVEVGAYDGTGTVEFAKLAKKVYSFEPTPDKVNNIRGKIKSAPADVQGRIEFHAAAVSNRSGTLPLFLPSRRKAGSQSDSLVPQPWGMSNTSVKVPVVTLDEIVKEHVNLLMVDTQGNELNVMNGAKKLLSEYGIDMIHTEFWPKGIGFAGQDPADYLNLLYDHGYRCLDCIDEAGVHSHVRAIMDKGGMIRLDSFAKYLSTFPEFHIYKDREMGAWADLLCIKV